MTKVLGLVPLSILRIKRTALSRRIHTLQSEHPERSFSKTPQAKAKQAAFKRAGIKVGNASGKATFGSLAASVMAPELVDFFIRYYARAGATYLDPFMGQGVRMQVAKMRGLDYIGMDCSEEFYKYITTVRARIDDGKTKIATILGDSRHPDEVPDGIGDFSFHSPPYWGREYYGSEPAQLGFGKSYDDFLNGLGDVARAWLPKFKPGAWHIVNVNDFRRGGTFYPFHADTIRVFSEAGWILHDTWIIDGLIIGLMRAFAVSWNMRRISPKVHEYALVFRKG